MERAWYADSLESFCDASDEQIIGTMVTRSGFADDPSQKAAWKDELAILRPLLEPYRGRGRIYLEFNIPRLGKRIDTLLLIDGVIVVLEFKLGERRFHRSALEQVHDYALDLKYFHETSGDKPIVPVLVATKAPAGSFAGVGQPDADGVYPPIAASPTELEQLLAEATSEATRPTPATRSAGRIDPSEWERGSYRPTPTIIEAARALFANHRVEEIARTDAGAVNLHRTTARLAEIIADARRRHCKSICFVTGVPGAGKTLVGLKIAAEHHAPDDDLYSVFLSGNGPLVKILREALARDRRAHAKDAGQNVSKKDFAREVASLVQNVHQFRDDCLQDSSRPPVEHIAIFDEAQRAWDAEMTAGFLRRKRGVADFEQSEPEFLIACLDRHHDWAVIVCLVGGGQEINRGEAGIAEWIDAVARRFPHWQVFISPRLTDSEYAAGRTVELAGRLPGVRFDEALHLSVSMRSFRAENLASFVKQLLDLDVGAARDTLSQLRHGYPIRLTRSLRVAKKWVRQQARGSERFGLLASSGGKRLKPLAISLRRANDLDNDVCWFLNDRDDVRSSFYLEDAATEFNVQGLELDWTIVAWDADLRMLRHQWDFFQFAGTQWKDVRDVSKQRYLLNAYRVLLTRARQGMVIFVPRGRRGDRTRAPEFYTGTFEYLRSLGIECLEE